MGRGRHLKHICRAAEGGDGAVAVLGDTAARRRRHHAGAGADVDAADVVAARAHDVQHCAATTPQHPSQSTH